jgi:hypothetical protein
MTMSAIARKRVLILNTRDSNAHSILNRSLEEIERVRHLNLMSLPRVPRSLPLLKCTDTQQLCVFGIVWLKYRLGDPIPPLYRRFRRPPWGVLCSSAVIAIRAAEPSAAARAYIIGLAPSNLAAAILLAASDPTLQAIAVNTGRRHSGRLRAPAKNIPRPISIPPYIARISVRPVAVLARTPTLFMMAGFTNVATPNPTDAAAVRPIATFPISITHLRLIGCAIG